MAWRAERRDPGHRARGRRSRCALLAGDHRRAQSLRARVALRGRRDLHRGWTASRHRGHRLRALHPQSHRRRSRPQRNPDHHRPEHGRQVDLSAPGRADRSAQSDRQLRSRRQSAPRHLRPHLHPRRRVRPARARRVDVHGGDARDREHPQQRHRPLADHPRRSRPRHRDVRRPLAGLGHHRIPARHARRAAASPSSPRTTTRSPTWRRRSRASPTTAWR